MVKGGAATATWTRGPVKHQDNRLRWTLTGLKDQGQAGYPATPQPQQGELYINERLPGGFRAKAPLCFNADLASTRGCVLFSFALQT